MMLKFAEFISPANSHYYREDPVAHAANGLVILQKNFSALFFPLCGGTLQQQNKN